MSKRSKLIDQILHDPVTIATRWATVLENPTGEGTGTFKAAFDARHEATVGLRMFLKLYGEPLTETAGGTGGEKVSKINVNTMVTAKLTDLGKAAIAESGEATIGMGDTMRCSFGMLMEVFGNACFCHKEQDQLFVNNEITIEGDPGPAEGTGCTPLETQLREVREAMGGEYKAFDLASAVSLIRGDAKAYVDRNIEYRMREQEIRKAIGDESSVSLPAVVRLMVEELERLREAARPVADSGKALTKARKALRGYYADMPIDEAVKGVVDLLWKAQGELAIIKMGEHEPAEASPTPRFRITTNGEKFRVEERMNDQAGPGAPVVVTWEPAEGGSVGHRNTPAEAETAMAQCVKAEEYRARPWVPVEEGTTIQQGSSPVSEAWATSAVLAMQEAKRLIGQHWPLPFPSIGEEPVELRLRTLEMLCSVIDRAAKGEAGRMSTEEGS